MNGRKRGKRGGGGGVEGGLELFYSSASRCFKERIFDGFGFSVGT